MATAPKAPPAATVASSKVPTGKIAILWRPERDTAIPRPPISAKSNRPFIYAWVDPAEVAKAKVAREEMDVLKSQMINPLPIKGDSIRLEPGLNWVPKDLWDYAVAESKRRYEDPDFAIQEDHIARLIHDTAIEALPLLNSAEPTGKIQDYDSAAQKLIIDAIDDKAVLAKMIDDSLTPSAREHLVKRIEQLSGFF